MNKTNCTVEEKENWSCNVGLRNYENEVKVKICYGQGEKEDENGDTVDAEYYSGLEIENIYYEIKEAHKKLESLFPITYKQVINDLNQIAEGIGLEVIEY